MALKWRYVTWHIKVPSYSQLSVQYPFGIRKPRHSYQLKIETTAMLSQRQYDALWNGNLRFVPVVVVAILCLSIATLSLSAVYGTQLARAPLSEAEVEYHGAHRRSNA